MKTRYEGPHGRRLLLDALKGNDMVEGNEALATRFAEKGELIEAQDGKPFIVQDHPDNDLYLIISGQADIHIHGSHVATRQAKNFVGEMALIDPAARRSATVTPRGPTVLLRMTEPAFHEVATEFPTLWKPIALVGAARLRQRTQFIRVPNPRPELFIGCSVEGLSIAHEIQAGLAHDDINSTVWDQDIFGPSGVPIDDLLKTLQAADFAAFMCGADDTVSSRHTARSAPRDNVVFELGLAMGMLGRERSFIVKQRGVDVKIPSDLLGVTPVDYTVNDPGRLAMALGPVCTAMRKSIARLGVRH